MRIFDLKIKKVNC